MLRRAKYLNYRRWGRRFDPVPDRHPIRKIIADRFKASVEVVLHEAKASPAEPVELVILAHSQGTVITFDRLDDGFLTDLIGERGLVTNIRIITAGSPLSHIYRHYFPYPAISKPRNVTWDNVFRIDDYIGTFIIGLDDFPKNWPLQSGGHSAYWPPLDPKTYDAFDLIAQFLPDPPPPPPPPPAPPMSVVPASP